MHLYIINALNSFSVVSVFDINEMSWEVVKWRFPMMYMIKDKIVKLLVTAVINSFDVNVLKLVIRLRFSFTIGHLSQYDAIEQDLANCYVQI